MPDCANARSRFVTAVMVISTQQYLLGESLLAVNSLVNGLTNQVSETERHLLLQTPTSSEREQTSSSSLRISP